MVNLSINLRTLNLGNEYTCDVSNALRNTPKLHTLKLGRKYTKNLTYIPSSLEIIVHHSNTGFGLDMMIEVDSENERITNTPYGRKNLKTINAYHDN